MNKFGEASPITILILLEETAADHCLSINHSLYDLIKQDIGWVLLTGYMQIDRYPCYKEKITIKTWLSRYKTIRGIRENIIYDEKGKMIGKAKGQWLFYDIKRKRPVKIFDDIQRKWSSSPEESVKHDIYKKIEAIDTAKYTSKFNINKYDLDTNGHVNNIRYLQWLLETIPEETIDNYYLYSIDGRFMSEAHYGHNIISLTNPDDKPNSFVHTIMDNKKKNIYATATTKWNKRI